MIFDITKEDFWHEVRLVDRGHTAKAPTALTYASIIVMPQETMCVTLLIGALTEVDIWATDVLNTYITAPCYEKIWTALGKKFGDDCVCTTVIV
jgi:hypothetical protein